MDAQNRTKGRPASRAAAMSDVGRVAGVSHQTVSRVINGSPNVRPETRERVIAAMDALGYRPNLAARALVTGRTKTLGVVGFNTTHYGPASVLFGIERAAHEQGYLMIVASPQALDLSSVTHAIERLRLQGVDGILVIAAHQEAANALRHASVDLPLVAVEAGPLDVVPVVSVDQFAGAVSATRHLLDLGHETVWHISGPSDWLESQERVQGWRTMLESAGAQPPPVLVGDFSARAGYDLGRRLAVDPAVTAIFAANDQMALGVLRAMHEAGRGVPTDVSVVGFDDIPEAAYFRPPLTTVRQDFIEVGSRGLRMLVRKLETGEQIANGSRVPAELVVRDSTSVPPTR
jgi:DNA-binding LacI/PurR family transcriptional regulator